MILLDSIHLYPCKGLAGISVKETNIDDFGPEYDRRWMLVDENNEFLTQ
ncbi:MAG: MOSC N-terminal beta barrel domain-containing protein, partial [SAR324 cluster bacterium]|nr:MOSC N-terminal beta barrel domain-containing protein [SAR324 cluster bacterium]